MKSNSSALKPEYFLLIIVLFGLGLRLNFFVGLNWSDDPGYVWDAYRIAEGKMDVPRYLSGLRSMTIYPVGFFFRIFGVSNFSATLYPLLCSLGSIVLAFYFGKMFFDEYAGLMSAFLLSFYPFDVINATWIMPDTPIAFFMALSVFLFLKREYFGMGTGVHSSNLLYFFSGFFVGVAYLVRESGLMILFFFIPYMIYRITSERKIKFNYSWFFLGILLVILAEGLFYSMKTGDFSNMMLRYRIVTGFYNEHTAGINNNIYYLPRTMLNLDNNNSFRWDNKYEVHYGLFFYVIIPAILYVLLIREKKAFPLVLWAITLFLWSNFGSMSLKEYVPIHRLERHMTIITMPCILILGYVLRLNLINTGHILRKASAILLVFSLLATSTHYLRYQSIYIDASTYDVKEIYRLLKDSDKKPIYCDPGVAGHLNFYFKFQRIGAIRILDSVKNCDNIKDAYVVVKGSRGYGTDPAYINKILQCAYNPPKNWTLVKTIVGPQIDVFAQYDPEVYYVS